MNLRLVQRVRGTVINELFEVGDVSGSFGRCCMLTVFVFLEAARKGRGFLLRKMLTVSLKPTHRLSA